jgi:threonine dehydratase
LRLKIKKTGKFKNSRKYLKLINDASVYDVAIDSPTTFAANLSAKEQNDIYLKREDLQPIFSFKNRGAYNKISNLSEEQRSSGIIAASAGNHAQGVALACKRLNINCNIVMPVTAPENKLNSVKRLGAKITLHGENLAKALVKAMKYLKNIIIHLFILLMIPIRLLDRELLEKKFLKMVLNMMQFLFQLEEGVCWQVYLLG